MSALPDPRTLASSRPTTLEPIESVIERLCAGEHLSDAGAEAVFDQIVSGTLSDVHLTAVLVALKIKGETVEELAGAARALRSAAQPFPRPDYLFGDTCGTGGDGAATINISTAVAFVSAAAGLPIAKHGNRSVSSRCGSADVLERLGARIDVPAEVSRHALDRTGFCFLFAPQYHPGLRHAAPVRRALKTRTVMNILGPCLNPAAPPVQIVGVADPRLVVPVAHTLHMLGCRRALVVHGSGLDEIALHGPTQAASVTDKRVEPQLITPEAAGLSGAPLHALRGGDPEENARRLEALLMGRGSEPERNAVALNTGALLRTAGLVRDIAEGAARALVALQSGAAYGRLQAYVEITRA